jgi:hypothetical protein
MRKEIRRSGNSISFFAFQDIITSVIGVVLFVALLLSLFIVAGSPSLNTTEQPRQAASQEEIDRLQELLHQVAALEEQLRVAKLAQIAGSDVEIDALRTQLRQILDQIAAVQVPGLKDYFSPEIQTEVAGLEKKLAATLERIENAERQAAERRSEVARMQEELEKVQQAQIQEADRKNDIFLIPETAQTTKSPLLLDVKDNLVNLQTLDGKKTTVRSSSSGDLSRLLEGFRPAHYYVVAYFRPSTFHLAGQMIANIRSLGYELGYDVLRDDQNVTLGQPEEK